MAVTYQITIGASQYFGSSTDFDKRISQHKNELEQGIHINKYLQNKYNKHQNIQAEILSKFDTREEAYREEQKLLDTYFGSKECLNLNPKAVQPPEKYGEDNPSTRPEVVEKILETKRKNGTLTPTKRPEVRAKISEAAKGRKYSKATKNKMSESQKILRGTDSYRDNHLKGVEEWIKNRPEEARRNSTKLFREDNPSFKLQTCIYCKREIQGASAFKRWHGDNCKNKINT